MELGYKDIEITKSKFTLNSYFLCQDKIFNYYNIELMFDEEKN